MMTKLISLALFTLLTISPTFAHEDNRIEELEKSVLSLTEAVAALQVQILAVATHLAEDNEASNQDSTSNKKWKSKENWRKLQMGMTQAQVRELLGEPERILGGTPNFWYYPSSGKVDLKDNEVERWSEPHFLK